MPVSGYVGAAAAGHAVSVFGIFTIPPLLPENDRLSQAANAVHLSAQFLIYLAVAVHVAARCCIGCGEDTAFSSACCRCAAWNRRLRGQRPPVGTSASFERK